MNNYEVQSTSNAQFLTQNPVLSRSNEDLASEANVLFSLLDRDHKGYLDVAVFSEYCKTKMTKTQIKELINELDQDGDGKVNVNDFISGLKKLEKYSYLCESDCNKQTNLNWIPSDENKIFSKCLKVVHDFKDKSEQTKNKNWETLYRQLVWSRRQQYLRLNMFDHFNFSEIDHCLASLKCQEELYELYNILITNENIIESKMYETVIAELVNHVLNAREAQFKIEKQIQSERVKHQESILRLSEELENQVRRAEETARIEERNRVQTKMKYKLEAKTHCINELKTRIDFLENLDTVYLDDKKLTRTRSSFDKNDVRLLDMENRLIQLGQDNAKLEEELTMVRMQLTQSEIDLHGVRQYFSTQKSKLNRKMLEYEYLDVSNSTINNFDRSDFKTNLPFVKNVNCVRQFSSEDSGVFSWKTDKEIDSDLHVEHKNPLVDSTNKNSISSLTTSVSSIHSPDHNLSNPINQSSNSVYQENCDKPKPTLFEVVRDAQQQLSTVDKSQLAVDTKPSWFDQTNSFQTLEKLRVFRIMLAGDPDVGKTCVLVRICDNIFYVNSKSTIGIDMKVRPIEVDGRKLVLQLWDTAGQERYRSVSACLYRKADGILLVYDCTSETSFINTRQWITTLQDNVGMEVPIALVANKVDLRTSKERQGIECVSYETGRNLAQEIGALFFETSAATGENINKLVDNLARLLSATEEYNMRKPHVKLNAQQSKTVKCCQLA